MPLSLVAGLALGVGLFLLHDNVSYYRVTSGSMLPTLAIGSRVAVEPDASPAIGDIVAFRPPQGAEPSTPVCGAAGQGAGFSAPCGQSTAQARGDTVLVKRIVAGPGDTVALQDGHAVVNGIVRSEPYAAPCQSATNCDFPVPVRVPAGQYFVLGDNRGVSDDSRFWGPVPASWIIGVVVRCGPLQTACQPLR